MVEYFVTVASLVEMNGTTALPANGMNKSQTSNSIHQQTNNTAKDHPYTITESPLGQPRPIRIVAVGAGASGLNLARQIDMHMENVDYVIYEKNSEVGGTWFENRYVEKGRESSGKHVFHGSLKLLTALFDSQVPRVHLRLALGKLSV